MGPGRSVSERSIRERAARVRSLQTERDQLHDEIRQARADGAKVRDLMEWTGYSRRRIFQLIKERD